MAKFSDILKQQSDNAEVTNLGFKNKIINGDFAIWQRGESFTAAGYTADRFRFDTNTDDSVTISKVDNKTFNSYKVSLTAGTTGTYNKIATRLEFPYEFSAKTFTLSFKIKASVATNITVGNKFVIGGTDTDDKNTTIAVGTTFENKTYTFTNADITAQTVDNSTDYFEIYFLFPVNTDVDIEIAEVQLEEGNVATEFEYVPYDIQLERCMRYYEILTTQITGTYTDTNNSYVQWYFKTLKRTIPTITYTASDSTIAPDGTIVGIECVNFYNSQDHVRIDTGTADAEL